MLLQILQESVSLRKRYLMETKLSSTVTPSMVTAMLHLLDRIRLATVRAVEVRRKFTHTHPTTQQMTVLVVRRSLCSTALFWHDGCKACLIYWRVWSVCVQAIDAWRTYVKAQREALTLLMRMEAEKAGAQEVSQQPPPHAFGHRRGLTASVVWACRAMTRSARPGTGLPR